MPPGPRLASVVNLRDVGGHRTRDGSRVRRGQLFRSGALDQLEPGDSATLTGLGLRTVYDLRSQTERTRLPDRLPDGARCVGLDVLAGSGETGPAQLFALLDDPRGADALLGHGRGRRLFEQQYRDFVALPSARAAFGRLFRALADPNRRPALVHCATGKDRTGWAVAALLLLIGVPRDVVRADYLASRAALRAFEGPAMDAFRRRGGDPELLRPIMAVRTAYLATALAEMEARFGTVEAYFEAGLDVDAATQRELRTGFVEAGP